MIDLKEIKNKIFKKENFYCLIIILSIFIIDRYSKIEIIKNFADTSFYLNDFLNFNLVWNTGIGFGLLSSNDVFFYNIFTLLILSVISILIYLALKSEFKEKFIYSIIIGGALGNLYDRLIFKAVPDFIDIHYHNFHWFTFNIADVFITIGVLSFLCNGLFIKENNK